MATSTHTGLTGANPAPADPAAQPRAEPAQVYRLSHTPDHWIVEPPRAAMPGEGSRTFTGARAQYEALLYAHTTFGSVRFFPY